MLGRCLGAAVQWLVKSTRWTRERCGSRADTPSPRTSNKRDMTPGRDPTAASPACLEFPPSSRAGN